MLLNVGVLLGGGAAAAAFPEVPVGGVLLEGAHVDALLVGGEGLPAGFGDLDMAPAGAFGESGLGEVGQRPADPVVEGSCPSAGQ